MSRTETSRRCSICGYDWPNTNVYVKCPSCGEKTDPIGNMHSMPEEEARALKLRLEFDRFYEKWDEEHDPDRLKPEPTMVIPADSS